MITEMEFSLYCDHLNLEQSARQLMYEIIFLDTPVRQVLSRVGNWTGFYPSYKTGKKHQFESKTVELPACMVYDQDDDVLGYFDQPSRFMLQYTRVDNRQAAFLYTPDFFVLYRDSAGWEEWKPEKELIRLAEKDPKRYYRDKQGCWRCPPAEAYAAQYRLKFRVRSSAELHPVFVRNLSFLEGYLRDPHLKVDAEALKTLRALFAEEPVLTLSEVLESVPAQQIYSAMLLKHIYIDLKAAPLADPDYVHIYRDQAVADAYLILSDNPYRVGEQRPSTIELGIGRKVIWDGRGWEIYNLGQTKVCLRSEQGSWVEIPDEEFRSLLNQGKISPPSSEVATHPGGVKANGTELLAHATVKDFQVANFRTRALKRSRAGETAEELQIAYRTLKRWEEKWKKAERKYGHGYLGLLPQYRHGGNTKRKLEPKSYEKMIEYIDKDYETDRQKGRIHSWGQLDLACKDAGLRTPSFKTFCREIKQRAGYEQTSKRKGRRAAYPEKPPEEELLYLYLDMNTPRHGDFPFQYVHLDHTELDIILVSSKTKKPLKRPWATFLTDAYSRRILAVYLTFDPPSYRTDMMILRECVRRYKRLPQTLIVDGGSDFGSIYLESVMVMYDITKIERPSGDPKAGDAIERLFGTTHTSFIYNLLGNTQATKVPRQATKLVDPKRKAVWTLMRFYVQLCKWCYEIYDKLFHSTLEQSPREAFEAGMLLAGERPYQTVEYDMQFLAMTMPSTKTGEAKVRDHGIKINYEYYWSNAFALPRVKGTKVPIRYDPFDISRAFAFVRGDWVTCHAHHHMALRLHSERERELLSDELRQRGSAAAKQYPLNIELIAIFLASAEAEEKFGTQRQYDEEQREILRAIDASYFEQFSLFKQPSLPLPLTTLGDNEEDEDENDETIETYGEYC